MALDSAKITRRRALAFALETTTGVEIAVSASDVDLDAMEPEIKFDDEGTERESASLSSRKKVPGAQSGEVTFKTHLTGIGSGTPAQVDLLTCCGFKNTGGVLSPLTATDIGNTGTFGLYKHGRFKSLFGTMLDCTLSGTRGKPVEMAFTGKGKRGIGNGIGPRDLAMISPAYIDVMPPVLKGVTFSIGSATYRLPGFELAFGNDVQLREDITDVTGFHAAQIVAHARRLRISPEALPLTSRDWYDVYENATELVWGAIIGDEGGNTIQMDAPRLQLYLPPEDEDANGFFRDKLEFGFNLSTDAGDDELTITYDLTSP